MYVKEEHHMLRSGDEQRDQYFQHHKNSFADFSSFWISVTVTVWPWLRDPFVHLLAAYLMPPTTRDNKNEYCHSGR
jgi:hypothetical protein